MDSLLSIEEDDLIQRANCVIKEAHISKNSIVGCPPPTENCDCDTSGSALKKIHLLTNFLVLMNKNLLELSCSFSSELRLLKSRRYDL